MKSKISIIGAAQHSCIYANCTHHISRQDPKDRTNWRTEKVATNVGCPKQENRWDIRLVETTEEVVKDAAIPAWAVEPAAVGTSSVFNNDGRTDLREEAWS